MRKYAKLASKTVHEADFRSFFFLPPVQESAPGNLETFAPSQSGQGSHEILHGRHGFSIRSLLEHRGIITCYPAMSMLQDVSVVSSISSSITWAPFAFVKM